MAFLLVLIESVPTVFTLLDHSNEKKRILKFGKLTVVGYTQLR